MSREKKSLEEARLVLRAFQPQGIAQAGKEDKERLAAEAAEQHRRHQRVIDKILQEKSLKDDCYLRSRFLEADTIRARAFREKVLLNEAPDGTFWAFPLREARRNKVTGMALKNAEGERMLGRRAGLWISYPTKSSREAVEQLVLTEHPIDAMSFYQLRKKEMQEVNTVFASTAGNPGLEQLKAIKELATLQKVPKVLLANDNDKAGAYYNVVYKKLLEELNAERKEPGMEIKEVTPDFKDFNADVRARKWLELRQLEGENRAQSKQQSALHPLKEEVAKLLFEKDYAQLAQKEVVEELRQSYVERELEGVKAHFSIREVALINNQPRLLQLLEEASGKQAEVPSPAGKPIEREELPFRPLNSKKEEKEREKASVAIERSPGSNLPAAGQEIRDKQLEKLYYKTIRDLQQKIKGDPAFREEYRRLELYRKYPHLGEEEVDTYLGLMQRRSPGIEQQLEVTKGKGKGLPGVEV